jgi:uncharacterized membrane protein YphA (DoxX/SURF4 family)
MRANERASTYLLLVLKIVIVVVIFVVGTQKIYNDNRNKNS